MVGYGAAKLNLKNNVCLVLAAKVTSNKQPDAGLRPADIDEALAGSDRTRCGHSCHLTAFGARDGTIAGVLNEPSTPVQATVAEAASAYWLLSWSYLLPTFRLAKVTRSLLSSIPWQSRIVPWGMELPMN